MLTGKKILLGITGSIAAYKSAYLTRLLVKAGAEVQVVMTPSATEFITPLSLSTLSKNPVHSQFTEDPEEGVWNNHVELGMWADAFVIAPVTANTLAKMAHGECDNLLMACYLSAKCPVLFAPAMDLDMYQHPSTKANIATLLAYGDKMIDPGIGELASGLEGEGRMAEPEEIVEALDDFFSKQGSLSGKTVLITAGPTHEAIDPVRFIGNHSTGKMGFALAAEAADRGANVELVTGPTHLELDRDNVHRADVTSAEEMFLETTKRFEKVDVAILSAAVADFAPADAEPGKIKKEAGLDSIELKPTKDILATLGDNKKHQLLIGFALETDEEVNNAKRKLEKKNLDLIVMNSLKDEGAGFGHDTNKVTFIDRHNRMESLELKSKTEVAKDIFDKIETLWNE